MATRIDPRTGKLIEDDGGQAEIDAFRAMQTHQPVASLAPPPQGAPNDPSKLLDMPVPPRPEPASAPVPIAPPPMPLGPATETRTSGQWQKSESSKVRTADEIAAKGREVESREGVVKSLGEKKDLSVKVAEDEAKLAAEEQTAIAAEQARVEAQNVAKEKIYADAIKMRDQQRGEYAKKELRDFWDDGQGGQRTGAKVAAYLMAGIGQFAASMSGGQNGALKVINDAIATDFARQKENIAKSRDLADMADRDVGAAERYMSIVDLDQKGKAAALYQKLASERKARLSKWGKSAAEIEGDAMIADFSQKAAALDVAYEGGLRKEVQRSAGGTSTTTPVTGGGAPSPENYVNGPDGRPLTVVANKDNAKAANEVIAATRDVLKDTIELDAIVKEHGTTSGGILSTEKSATARGQSDALRENLIRNFSKLKDNSAVTAGDSETLGRMVPGDALFGRTPTHRAALAKVREITMRQGMGRLRSLGMNDDEIRAALGLKAGE